MDKQGNGNGTDPDPPHGPEHAVTLATCRDARVRRARIAKGEWAQWPAAIGEAPQQEHDVGRDTVRHAVEILRDEGLGFTVPRRQRRPR